MDQNQTKTIEEYCDQFYDRKSECLPWNSMCQIIRYNHMFAEKMAGKSIDINEFIKSLRKPMNTLVQNLTN